MIETKVRLSIEIPGATMLAPEMCENNPKKYTNNEKITVLSHSKKKISKEALNIQTRKSKPAKQCISICKEAYDYMTSIDGNEAQFKISQGKWKSMSAIHRLDMHMHNIAEALGGQNAKYTFEVFDD